MNILIVNAHWNNRGDEAALCSLITSLLKICDANKIECALNVVFKETKTVKSWPYEGVIKYETTKYLLHEDEFNLILDNRSNNNTDIQKEIDMIDKSDLVIYAPGGAVINDRFWWKKQLEYIFPIAYAQLIGKKTMFASPSIGPFEDKHNIRDNILQRVDALCLRESISMMHLQNSVGIQNNQTLSCDLVFSSEIDNEKVIQYKDKTEHLNLFIEKYNKIVGITISDLSWNVGYNNEKTIGKQIESAFEGFIIYLRNRGIGVILIPQLFGEQDDEKYLIRYAKENCFLLSSVFNSDFQQYIISNLYALVGVRYHSNIFAAKMCTPMIPVVYEEKMRGFIKDYEMTDWGIEIKNISEKLLIEKYEALEQEYTARKEFLKVQREKCENKANKTFKTLELLMKKDSGYVI